MGEQYLISARFKIDAKIDAYDMKLRTNQWVYIPWEKSRRERMLLGRRVSDEKYLIGGFTEEEMQYLLLGGRK